jgi:ubiquinone/menaquinone biosynthesis C-methylase UbiE
MSRSQELDRWAAWLFHRRDGDDAEQQRRAFEHLVPIRDRVLEKARIAPGDVVLDVGAGDGLIAFEAIERVGPRGRVVLSDISRDLLDHARDAASDLGGNDRVSFVEAGAEDLAGVADASVDVVTTRSVLIYVDDKAKAFSEFARVLRLEGRVSIFEPINNYFPLSTDEFWGFDASPVSDLVERIHEHEGWTGSSSETDPVLNFTDKDLVAHAEAAGFGDVRLELVVEVKPGSWVVDWERLLHFAPNPNAQTVAEAMEGALTEDERSRFTEHLRLLVDAGDGTLRSAVAYLQATR